MMSYTKFDHWLKLIQSMVLEEKATEDPYLGFYFPTEFSWHLDMILIL